MRIEISLSFKLETHASPDSLSVKTRFASKSCRPQVVARPGSRFRAPAKQFVLDGLLKQARPAKACGLECEITIRVCKPF